MVKYGVNIKYKLIAAFLFLLHQASWHNFKYRFVDVFFTLLHHFITTISPSNIYFLGFSINITKSCQAQHNVIIIIIETSPETGGFWKIFWIFLRGLCKNSDPAECSCFIPEEESNLSPGKTQENNSRFFSQRARPGGWGGKVPADDFRCEAGLNIEVWPPEPAQFWLFPSRKSPSSRLRQTVHLQFRV